MPLTVEGPGEMTLSTDPALLHRDLSQLTRAIAKCVSRADGTLRIEVTIVELDDGDD